MKDYFNERFHGDVYTDAQWQRISAVFNRPVWGLRVTRAIEQAPPRIRRRGIRGFIYRHDLGAMIGFISTVALIITGMIAAVIGVVFG